MGLNHSAKPAVRQQRPHPAIHCFGHDNKCTRGTTCFGTGDHLPSNSNAEVAANLYLNGKPREARPLPLLRPPNVLDWL